MAVIPYLVLTLLLGYVSSENATLEADTCDLDSGKWGALLEEWATVVPDSDRHGRILALPTSNGYYVTERIDGPFVPPPPPGGHMTPGPHMSSGQHGPPAQHGSPGHHGSPGQHMSSHGPHHPPGPPPHGFHMPQNYNEWEVSPPPPAGGKIVNRPPNPYKDKFKPSYPPPSPGQPPRGPQRPNTIDRVDEPPRKQVSDTDLYLLSAIEKLVYRVDLMEKRLRKMEESMHHLVVGAETKPDPCPTNFSRVGASCYQWSREAADWKGASVACRRERAALLELAEPQQRRVLLAKLLADKQLKGSDFWTGGLNPGLLWIWSHSARPVEANNTNTTSIIGEGRCLALVHDPAAASYAYRGQDCALKHRYICQKDEDKAKLSNAIEKAARSLKFDKARKSKVLWDVDE